MSSSSSSINRTSQDSDVLCPNPVVVKQNRIARMRESNSTGLSSGTSRPETSNSRRSTPQPNWREMVEKMPFAIDPFEAYEKSKLNRSQETATRQLTPISRHDSVYNSSEQSYDMSETTKGETLRVTGGGGGSDPRNDLMASQKARKRRSSYRQLGIIGALLFIVVLVTVIAVVMSKKGKQKDQDDQPTSSSVDQESALDTQALLSSSDSSPTSSASSSASSAMDSIATEFPSSTSSATTQQQSVPSSPATTRSVTSSIVSPSPSTQTQPSSSIEPASAVPDAIVQARSAAGAQPLTWSNDLQSFAQSMVESCCTGSCGDFDYDTIPYTTNDVLGQADSLDQAAVVWLADRGGDEATLISARNTQIGCASGSCGTRYACFLSGTRRRRLI